MNALTKLIIFCGVSFAILVPFSLQAKMLEPLLDTFGSRDLGIHKQATHDRFVLSEAVNSISSRYPVSKSSLDWLLLELNDGQNGFADIDITVTSKSQGTVLDISSDSGKRPLDGRNYYVGKKGTYQYNFSLTLDIAGKKVDCFFSPRRTQLMQVVKKNAAGVEETIDRDSIKVGDMIEIVEVIDLAADATNDNHIQSVTVKVLDNHKGQRGQIYERTKIKSLRRK